MRGRRGREGGSSVEEVELGERAADDERCRAHAPLRANETKKIESACRRAEEGRARVVRAGSSGPRRREGGEEDDDEG